jgi:hypothetical protein
MGYIDHFDIENGRYMMFDWVQLENYQYILDYLRNLIFDHNDNRIFVLRDLVLVLGNKNLNIHHYFCNMDV